MAILGWFSEIGNHGTGILGKGGKFSGPLRLVTQKSGAAGLHPDGPLTAQPKRAKADGPFLISALHGRESEQIMSNNTNFPKNAIRGLNEKPIAFVELEAAARAAALMRDYLGRNYREQCAEDGNSDYYLVPVDIHQDKGLTVPERAAVEALAWYCREYAGGLERGQSMTFPKIVHYESDAEAITDSPLSFRNEGRAYMFAEVAERCFHCDAQVIETPAGWTVAVTWEAGLDARTLASLQGVCRVLLDYTVEAAFDASASTYPEQMHQIPNPEAREAWHERKNAQADRIEAKLDALLANMDKPIENITDAGKRSGKSTSKSA